MISQTDKLARLRLYRSERIGPATYRGLMERFGNAQTALEAVPELAKRGGSKRSPKLALASACETEFQRLESMGGTMLFEGDADFPLQLSAADGSPPLISVLGHPGLLIKDQVGMVGARNASPNGLRFAQAMGKELGEAGFVVTSGLARGLDRVAHTGALATGTVAVVAGGVDVIYPLENTKLYRQIVEQGAVVSEMPLSTEPAARLFPKRNRIIAGLVRGLVLIEAKIQSGTLITARAANDFGRTLFAVPGAPYDPRAGGCNLMIRQGATLTRSAKDVIEDLQAETQIEEPGFGRNNRGFSDTPPPDYDQASVDKVRETLCQLITIDATSVDDLCQQCQVSAKLVQAALIELELAGRIDRLPGGRVAAVADLKRPDLGFDF